MNQDTDYSTMIASLWRVIGPGVYTIMLALFMRFATLGYLTPQQATDLTKWFMDSLVAGAPLALAIYLGWKRTRAQMVKTTDAIPGVLGVAVIPEVDKQVESPTVTTPVKLLPAITQSNAT